MSARSKHRSVWSTHTYALGVAPEVGVVLAAHEDGEERVPMAPEVGAAGGGAEKSRGAVEQRGVGVA
jgi:hypothetical protein